ncbi:MAG: hypothetical protein PVG03_08050, partial [Desulfarculaceae bacterium]
MRESLKANDFILGLLRGAGEDVEKKLEKDVLLFRGPLLFGLDDMIRLEVERLASQENKRDALAVVVETTGGFIEVTERLHRIFRHHYDNVSFIVPNFAYSAGTVLVLSGNEIWMDYYGVLGPIDPQLKKGEDLLPGIGYLQKYKDLVEKSKNNALTDAEVEFLVRKFDPAQLFALEQARDHSISLIENWLVKYKFKNWVTRKTSGKKVTEDYKRKRAKDIAKELGNATRWKSHARGISREILESDDIGLSINKLEEQPDL